MYECRACNLTFRRSSNLRRHQRTSCPSFGHQRTEVYSGCGGQFYRRDVRQRHEGRCRGTGREHDQTERVRTRALQSEAPVGQHQTESAPDAILEVFVDPTEDLALEMQNRRQASTQTSAENSPPGNLHLRRGEQVLVRGRSYTLPTDCLMCVAPDDITLTEQATQTTETSGLDFNERWSLRTTLVGFDTEGNPLSRSEVRHEYSCPVRTLRSYGGPYNQFFVPPEYAPHPPFGGIIPPGASLPPRPPMANQRGYEKMFRRETERHARGL
ncbi:hypothetical protein HOLleu_24384 [Holothuria leucospilota]|uniref:C2H2-type domain-containing protein n=1 Tax=Holothuria leucospilota TaxID=206669 RepID=A0A9Q1BWE7_HOLLE|nr:hypothetical protein HOLleu_24384 [Holothuria leucospilota]